jgi:hypothetical protein
MRVQLRRSRIATNLWQSRGRAMPASSVEWMELPSLFIFLFCSLMDRGASYHFMAMALFLYLI